MSDNEYVSDEEAHAAGQRILRELGWPIDSGFADMDPKFWAFTTETLFGRVWARPGLSLRERAIVTLSVLLAVDADRGSMNHIRYAHNVGITEEEMREIIIQVGFYAGWPKGAHAMARFHRILNEPGNGFNHKPAANDAADSKGTHP
jgi:4-carboxymuconolactone decarboxylase